MLILLGCYSETLVLNKNTTLMKYYIFSLIFTYVYELTKLSGCLFTQWNDYINVNIKLTQYFLCMFLQN